MQKYKLRSYIESDKERDCAKKKKKTIHENRARKQFMYE